MANASTHEESEEIYHRIYRLYKRRIAPHTIAATLNLPLRTVLGVINRLEKRSDSQDLQKTGAGDDAAQSGDIEFLDIYFYPKTRYAILDMVGTLTDTYKELLENEIQKALESPFKAVAMRMSDVSSLSESAAGILLAGKSRFAALERYLALLDPSPAIEPDLVKYEIENAIPVFGTERAFEDAAYSKKGKQISRHQQKKPS